MLPASPAQGTRAVRCTDGRRKENSSLETPKRDELLLQPAKPEPRRDLPTGSRRPKACSRIDVSPNRELPSCGEAKARLLRTNLTDHDHDALSRTESKRTAPVCRVSGVVPVDHAAPPATARTGRRLVPRAVRITRDRANAQRADPHPAPLPRRRELLFVRRTEPAADVTLVRRQLSVSISPCSHRGIPFLQEIDYFFRIFGGKSAAFVRFSPGTPLLLCFLLFF